MLNLTSVANKTLMPLINIFVLFTFIHSFAQPPSDSHLRFDHTIFTNEALHYRMISGAASVGELNVNISYDPAEDVIHIVESSSGLIEQSQSLTFRSDSALEVLRSSAVISKDPRFQQAHIEYSERAITGEIKRPRSFGGNQQVSLNIEKNTKDVYAVHHLIRASRLEVDQLISFPIYIPLANKTAIARGWVSGIERVKVPAGRFTCYRVEGFSGESRWILYVDTRYPHRIIKRTLPAIGVEYELVAINHKES